MTRDGNLRLTAEPASGESILGSLKDEITFADDDLDQPTNIKVPLLTRDKAMKRSKAVETVW